MVRKTKEDAELTRHLLLDTAEKVFWENGVAATSLADIASAAGLTRGAIYWHFNNKLDIFNALCDRITPLIDELEIQLLDSSQDPCTRLWQHSHSVFNLVRDNDRLRRICGIHHLGCEQVGEMAPLLQEQISWNETKRSRLQHVLEEAQALGLLRQGIDPALAAIGLHSLHGGLMHSWMLTIDSPVIHHSLSALLSPYFEGIFCSDHWRTPLPAMDK